MTTPDEPTNGNRPPGRAEPESGGAAAGFLTFLTLHL